MKIKDLANGLTFSGKLLVRSSSIRETKAKKLFLAGVLTDGTDEMAFNMWDYTSEKSYYENEVVWVEGKVGSYNDKLQMTLSSIEPSTAKPGEFLPQGPEGTAECWEILSRASDFIENHALQTLVKHIYSKYGEQIAVCPAATGMHHAYVGGLAQHTLEVLNFADGIASNFDNNTRDLIIAGAMLHDIGKVHVYDTSGVSISFTLAGTQQEHILLGISMIDEAARELGLPPETKDLVDILKHIIASHHGSLEYGSPVLPACLPAYIVSIADGISATTHMLLNAKVGPNGMTEKVYPLGNKPKMSQNLVDKAMLRSTRPMVTCTNCGNIWYQSADAIQRCTQCGEINSDAPQEK